MDKPQTNSPTRLDELSLKDIIQAVVKKKWVALFCTILMFLVTAFYGLTVKPVYVSRALIQIGEIPIPPGLVISPGASITTTFEDPVKLAGRLKITQKLLSVTIDRIDKVPTNILNLTYHDHNPISAQAHLKKITNDLVKQHNALFDQTLKSSKDQVNSLQKQLNSVQLQLDLYEKQITRLSSNDSLKMGLLMEKMRLTESRFDLEGRIRQQELLLSDIFVKPTLILEEPSLARKPIKPNLPLYLVLGVILGTIVGVSAAVFLERIRFWRADAVIGTKL